jgi:hypothetical protein
MQVLRSSGSRGIRRYVAGECNILLSRDPDSTGILRWHISISHPERYPTWDEIRDARYALTPHDIEMVMLLPPPEEYVNTHPNAFHLWETFDRR